VLKLAFCLVTAAVYGAAKYYLSGAPAPAVFCRTCGSSRGLPSLPVLTLDEEELDARDTETGVLIAVRGPRGMCEACFAAFLARGECPEVAP